MANEEQVGFHKGSIATLVKEREELARLLQIVNSLLQAHVKSLKSLGIDLEKELKNKKSLDEKIA